MRVVLKVEEDERGKRLVLRGPGWVAEWWIWSAAKVKAWLRRHLSAGS